MDNRILALSLRPKRLCELVGQDRLVNGIQAQFRSGRIPHFFLIDGPVGAGKTTLGRILALLLQLQSRPFRDLEESDWQSYRKYDIVEINAANKNGVDDMRQLIQDMRFLPMPPSKAKIRILDEAHQLSHAAQNSLITETEDVPGHVFFIFITSAAGRLIPALRDRAFHLSPLPLDDDGVNALVSCARERSGFDGEVDTLLRTLRDSYVTSPRAILQRAERYFCGLQESPAEASKLKVEALVICRLVAAGDWVGCATKLGDVAKQDAYPLRVAVCGYLKALLVKASGGRAAALSRAIERVASPLADESVTVPALCAALCLACQEMTPPRARLAKEKQSEDPKMKAAAE